MGIAGIAGIVGKFGVAGTAGTAGMVLVIAGVGMNGLAEESIGPVRRLFVSVTVAANVVVSGTLENDVVNARANARQGVTGGIK